MRLGRVFAGTVIFAAVAVVVLLSQFALSKDEDWSIDASLIESCSCNLFCPCYFSPEPDHGGMCDFNIIYTVNSGHYGDVKIDGIKVWLAGNLEGDGSAFSGGWLTFAFDKSVTKEQQDAALSILTKIYPLKWNVVAVETKPITIKKDGAVIDATMAGAELKMKPEIGPDGKNPVVIKNLQYFGETSNDGFNLYRSITNKYDDHDQGFDYSNTTAFTIHIKAGSQGS